MNKIKFLSIPILVGGLLVGCDEPAEQDITSEIVKIETMYGEAGKRTTQQQQPEVKSSAPKWYIDKLFREEMDRLAKTEFKSRLNGRVNAVGDYDIGLVSHNGLDCPGERIMFYMDCDNEYLGDPPATSVLPYDEDLDHPWKIIGGGDRQGDIYLTFCRVDGLAYASSPYNKAHAVLKLGPLTVPGALYEITRHFDNEDNENHNYYSGTIAPNFSSANTDLYFTGFPLIFAPQGALPSGLGVLATPDQTVGDCWRYFIDDEDGSNANYWIINGLPSSYWNGYYMEGGVNTGMYVLMFD